LDNFEIQEMRGITGVASTIIVWSYCL